MGGRMTVHEDSGGSSPEHLPSRLSRNDARGALSQVGQLMILVWFDRRRIAVDKPRVGALARLVDTTGSIDSLHTSGVIAASVSFYQALSRPSTVC
jgi:hypothetical protein